MPAPYSLRLFEHLHRTLPPLTPPPLSRALGDALNALKKNPALTPRDVEHAMIAHGKAVWSYRRAFHELLHDTRERHGFEYVRAHLPEQFAPWIDALVENNISFQEFARGPFHIIVHLTPEERTLMTEAIVNAAQDIVQHATQAALGAEREEYKKRINEYEAMLRDIETELVQLRARAENEKGYPALAQELYTMIHHFELALAGLKPHHVLAQLHFTQNYHADRKEHLQIHKEAPEGILFTDLPLPRHDTIFDSLNQIG